MHDKMDIFLIYIILGQVQELGQHLKEQEQELGQHLEVGGM